jgi:20S proteasome subunit beta 1
MIRSLLSFLQLSLLLVVSIAAATPEVDLGTTLVAIPYRDGIVVGADSRTSVGTYVSHRYAEKISLVSPSCVVARSGSAAATQQLAKAAREHVHAVLYRHGDRLTVTQLAHWLQARVYASNGGGGTVSLLVAGYNHVTHTPELYSLAPSGALLEHHTSKAKFAVAGSGSTFCLGFLDHHIQEGHDELDEEAAIKLAQQALELAMCRDGSSGGLCRFVVLNAAGRREWSVVPSRLT